MSPALTRPKAILFDWDNTLADSWPIIHQALLETFTQMGLKPWTMEMVKQRVSRSMRDSFPVIFGDDWERASDIYQKHYRAIHLENFQPLPGAAALIADLATKPVYVAVVSNKKGNNLRVEAEHIGWHPYFTKIIGAGDTSRDKPAPDPVHAALAGSNIDPGEDVWFIGDSVIDMECAHATGCVPIWYGDLRAEPLRFPFRHRVADHAELAQLIASVF